MGIPGVSSCGLTGYFSGLSVLRAVTAGWAHRDGGVTERAVGRNLRVSARRRWGPRWRMHADSDAEWPLEGGVRWRHPLQAAAAHASIGRTWLKYLI